MREERVVVQSNIIWLETLLNLSRVCHNYLRSSQNC